MKEEGEVKLPVYEAASSQRGMFAQVVEVVGEGLGLRAVGRVMEDSMNKSAAGRMWEEKSREQLVLLRGRPLRTASWLALVVDGVWLTREICVVVGIDADGTKQGAGF